MQIKSCFENYVSITCDLLAYPVFEEDATDVSLLAALDKITQNAVSSLLSTKAFKPELHNVCRLYKPAGLNATHLLFMGAGKKSDFTPAKLREIAGTTVRVARSIFCKQVAFVTPKELSAGQTAGLVTEGAIYANYDADLYKTKDKENRDIETFTSIFENKANMKEIEESIRRGVIIGDAVNFARTLANEPANIMTPAEFATRAVAAATTAGLDVRVMEREEIESLGMNALLAVGKGSDQPPKMIVLRSSGALKKSTKGPIVIVGKGVTFDSGGISLKPADKMEEMKCDMAGGAATLCSMIALGQLCPQKPIVGVIPLVENLPDGRATKPGDVVKSYLGKTIEIINTDAEGRLILADAIAYARKDLGAHSVIDIATLTGACVVALGNVNGGMMGTDQKTIDRLRANCKITGEGLWQLPIDEAYQKAIRSEIADIKNVGNGKGGVITAAKFLQEFAEDTPWVHLDIAGLDIDTEGRPYASKGATGFGVRTFVQLLEM